MFQDSDDEEGTSAFQPSRWKWLKLLPQKMLRRNGQAAEELTEVLQGMKTLREDLDVIRKRMKKFAKCSKQLADAAQDLSMAVETDEEVRMAAIERIEPLLMDDSAYQNLVKKIAFMDDLLVNQTNKLKFIRLNREKAERLLENLRKKGVQNEEKEQLYFKTIQQATREHDELLGEMMRAMTVQVQEVQENGVTSLIKSQLQHFKMNQFQLFLNYQRLINGPDEQGLKDLDNIWSGYSKEVANTIDESGAERNRVVTMLAKEATHKDSDFDDVSGYETDDESQRSDDVTQRSDDRTQRSDES